MDKTKTGIGWQEKRLRRILMLALTFLLSAGVLCASPAVFVIKDDMGNAVTFEKPVSRIVSLYTGHTENLFAIGAGHMLVAASQADDGRITGSLPRLGIKPGVEQIAALGPDVVLTRPMLERSQKALYDKLRSLGIRVLSLDPPSWDDLGRYVELLGLLTGRSDEARQVFEQVMKTSVRTAAERDGADPGVLLITNGKTMATCTRDSWAAHIIAAAGGRNAAGDAKPVSPGSVIAGFGAERMLALGGDVDVILLQQGAMNSLNAQSFMEDPRFSGMSSVRARKVYDVAEADISRPSLLRLQRGAIDDLRKLIAVGGVSE